MKQSVYIMKENTNDRAGGSNNIQQSRHIQPTGSRENKAGKK